MIDKTLRDALSYLGRLGGQAVFKKYGKKHFSEAGKKGAEGKLKKYGQDYFLKLSKKGVEARLKKKKIAPPDTP